MMTIFTVADTSDLPYKVLLFLFSNQLELHVRASEYAWWTVIDSMLVLCALCLGFT